MKNLFLSALLFVGLFSSVQAEESKSKDFSIRSLDKWKTANHGPWYVVTDEETGCEYILGYPPTTDDGTPPYAPIFAPRMTQDGKQKCDATPN